jgi:hypothetical protein
MHRILCAIAGALFAAACASEGAKTVPGNPSSAESACLSYGFVPGTTAYTNCIQREIDARQRGKLGPTYDQILVSPRQ